MHLIPMAQCLALIVTANITPPVASIVFRERFSRRLDQGLNWIDGAPLFGRTKTIRGVILAIPAAALVGHSIGVTATLGAVVATAAMAGDLASSFCKRRLGFVSSAAAPGIDQIPESLLPAVVCASPLALSWYDVAAVAIIFSLGDVIVSPNYKQWWTCLRPRGSGK